MSTYRIQKYIAREVTVPFLLGVVLFTFVLLLGRMLKLIELIVENGVQIADIFHLFAALMPSFFVITVPLSFLLATMLALGRLSGDSEIVAMKAAGISIYHIARVLVAMALVICAVTAALTLYAEPLGRSNMRGYLLKIAYSKPAASIKAQVFNQALKNLVVYADKVDSHSGIMQGVFISDNRTATTPLIITARQGRITPGRDNAIVVLHLQRGTIHRQIEDSGSTSYQVINFNSYDVTISDKKQQPGSTQPLPRAKEMSTAMLLQQIEHNDNNRKYLAQLQERLILPLSPLLFALIAIPLGVRSHRSARGGMFAVALLVFLIYYMALSFSKTLVLEKGWPVITTMWAPTALFFALCAMLLYHTAQERPLPGSNFLNVRLPAIVSNLLSRR